MKISFYGLPIVAAVDFFDLQYRTII